MDGSWRPRNLDVSKKDDSEYREKVFAVVRSIPAGRVMTYGQIAVILGEGYTARTIGYVMGGSDAENIPWQRVINSQGKCSTGRLTIPINLQQELLEAEGIVFSNSGKCDLRIYRWLCSEDDQNPEDRPTLFTRRRCR